MKNLADKLSELISNNINRTNVFTMNYYGEDPYIRVCSYPTIYIIDKNLCITDVNKNFIFKNENKDLSLMILILVSLINKDSIRYALYDPLKENFNEFFHKTKYTIKFKSPNGTISYTANIKNLEGSIHADNLSIFMVKNNYGYFNEMHVSKIKVGDQIQLGNSGFEAPAEVVEISSEEDEGYKPSKFPSL